MKRALALVLLGLVVTSPAHAQSDSEAVAAYKKGRTLLSQDKPQEALAELKRSLMMLPSPNTELLIGHALRDLDRFGEAMETYERVLANASAKVQDGESRYQRTLEEAGRWSAALRPKVGKLIVTLSSSVTDATLRVDDRDITLDDGRAGFWVSSGVVSVVATTPDGREARQEVDVTPGGSAQRVELTFPAPVEASPAPSAPAPDERPPEDDTSEADFPWPPWPTYVAAGVGVAGFALFAGFGAASASTASDLDACAPSCPESLREDADAGKRNQLIANIGLGVGITGLAAAGTIWILDAVVFDDEDSDTSEVTLHVGPAGAMLSGSF